MVIVKVTPPKLRRNERGARGFTQIHNGMFQNKRKKRFTTYDIHKIEDEKHQVILDKATAILRDNNITNFDEHKLSISFVPPS